MTKPKKAKKWDDNEPLSDVFKRLYGQNIAPSENYYLALYWWAQGIVDERRQRGDYDKKAKKPKPWPPPFH